MQIKGRIFKFATSIALSLTLVGTGSLALSAYAIELIPVGEAVGIEIKTAGVLVAGVTSIDRVDGSASPAKDAGVLMGDIIVKLGADEIKTAEDFSAASAKLNGDEITITVERQGKTLQFNITPFMDSDGIYRLGLILRDGVSGIGTITFYNPADASYGALGHAINDVDTGVLLPVGEGNISNASVSSVQVGEAGNPGKLNGVFDFTDILGDIDNNTNYGIFGTMDEAPQGDVMETATADEVHDGAAIILSQVAGEQVREYEVIISKISRSGEDRLMIEVVDEELLELTGGIVQGMSGSPIIQDGKLVGAVTHVLVNDPTSGYGVFIDDMLAAA